jgi:hypothetical protein
MVHRSDFSGALCGYVGVWPEHPLFGLDTSALETALDRSLDVHGGITFASLGAIHEEGARLLVWAFGFDCSHAFDDTPWIVLTHARLSAERGDTELTRRLLPRGRYWTLDMVMDEVDRLALQLQVLASSGGKPKRQLPP